MKEKGKTLGSYSFLRRGNSEKGQKEGGRIFKARDAGMGAEWGLPKRKK